MCYVHTMQSKDKTVEKNNANYMYYLALLMC